MTVTEISPDALNNLLDQAANQINSGKNFEAQKTFHASSGYQCGLRQWYARMGQKPTDEVYEPEWELDARVGDALHEALQKRIVSSGQVVMLPSWERDKTSQLQPAIEIPLNELTLTQQAYKRVKVVSFGGRVDALIYLQKRLKPDGIRPQVAYLEIKTKPLSAFNNPQSYWVDDLSHWEWQVQTCIELFENPVVGRIDLGLIYAISVDKDPITKKRVRRLFMVTPNPEFTKQELERLENLASNVYAKQMPDPEPHRGPCRFGKKIGCPYYSLCPASATEKDTGGKLPLVSFRS